MVNCCPLTRHSWVNPQQISTTVMMCIVVNKSADNTTPHSICFLPQYQHQRKCLFFSESQLQKALHDIIWRKQRYLDSYRQQQISQWDCKVTSNCGKRQTYFLSYMYNVHVGSLLTPYKGLTQCPALKHIQVALNPRGLFLSLILCWLKAYIYTRSTSWFTRCYSRA